MDSAPQSRDRKEAVPNCARSESPTGLATDPFPDSADDLGFAAVLEEYLTRLESGAPFDRNDFISRHAEHADRLREFVADLDLVDEELARAKDDARAQGVGRSLAIGGPREVADSMAQDPPGVERLGHFLLLHEVGRGGQGIVYKARQLGTNRTVALKVVREGLFASKVQRQRFEREIELVSGLKHPNIVTIYECGHHAGRDHYAMEFIDGEPLDAYLNNRTLTISATIELGLQICEAVHYAHQHGVLHRDLKPSNIFVDGGGAARVLDFGLARPLHPTCDEGAITEAGEFAGTWNYASPEQVLGDPSQIDVRTDLYVLGVILFEMLTDCLPYSILGRTKDAIAHEILTTPPVRPSQIRRDIDDELETIVLCALQKEPQRRYQSVAGLIEDLRRYLRGDAIHAKRDSRWYVARKTLQRYRLHVAIGGCALTALVAFAITVAVLYSRALRAQATISARTQVVRASQQYVLTKLDELNWAGNRLAEIEPFLGGFPAGAVLRAAAPIAELEKLLLHMPDDILPRMLRGSGPDQQAAVDWLRANEAGLTSMEMQTVSRRWVFGVAAGDSRGLVFHDRPETASLGLRAAQALAARAIELFRRDDHDAAVGSLTASREIAQSLGNGRLLFHKAFSVLAREAIYDAVLDVLGLARGASVDAYASFILVDPPLVGYRLGMIAERQRVAQLIEGATVADGGDGDPRIDLALLNAEFGGLYAPEGAGWVPVSPSEALALVDEYIAEVETWDALSPEGLQARAESLLARIEQNNAWAALRPLMAGYREAFLRRLEVDSKRAAAIAMARRHHREGIADGAGGTQTVR
jgi:tRNA A-37 threonylcarbamoyl transferase component Bud32